MKRWLLKKLGGVTRHEHMRLYNQYLKLNADILHTIELYNMQSQWEQVKQQRAAGRLH